MSTKNLLDGLKDEIKRVEEELLPEYDKIPQGAMAAMMLREEVRKANEAINAGDTVQMLRSYKALSESS